MANQNHLKKLHKFIQYVLGHKPDEFGLVLDKDGFIKIKEFLKAVTEEEGYRNLRMSSINELMISLRDHQLEIQDQLIRTTNPDNQPNHMAPIHLPKLLYTCVRRRAYPVVAEKGINFGENQRIVLAQTKDMALRIGKRFDQEPVMLTIQMEQAKSHGTIFIQFGDLFYTNRLISTASFTGPPVPEKKPEQRQKKAKEQPAAEPTPGSFIYDPFAPKSTQKRKKKSVQWKEDVKQMRRQKKRSKRLDKKIDNSF